MVGIVNRVGDRLAGAGEPDSHGAVLSGVVTWEGAGQPIMLTIHSPDGEVAVPLTPVRALELAKDLIEPAVRSIKTNQWGPGWPG